MIIFCASIAFQLAGALLVLIQGLSTRRDDIIKSFASCDLIIRDGNEKSINDLTPEYLRRFRRKYVNIFAFAYLTIGYLIGYWGEKKDGFQFFGFLSVLLLTVALIIIGKTIIDKVFMESQKVKTPITNDDLVRLNIPPHLESISNEEIDEVFNSVF